jgi:stage II sporulation protein D
MATALALTGCAPPTPGRREAREPELRIALASGAPEVAIGGQGAVTASSAGASVFSLDPGTAVTLVPDGSGVAVRGRSSGRYQAVMFESSDPADFLTVGGKPYRGAIEVSQRGGRLTVVNRIALEAYLLGVVTAEMGRRASNEAAALEAQAVVSRTYALRTRGRFAAEGYDLTASVGDQSYGGVDAEDPGGVAAVRATTGVALTYQGALIKAFFHSTCGYATASPEEVFRTVGSEPYLRSVSDRRRGGYYCDISPRFRWRVQWSLAGLRAILRRTAPALGVDGAGLEEVTDVRVRRTGHSGRAVELAVSGPRGEIAVRGPDIRTVLQTPEGAPLGSTAIQLSALAGEQGRVITAAGAGWGHGVGMCQWGAVGRARAGQDYRRILTSYFPGTRLERWY